MRILSPHTDIAASVMVLTVMTAAAVSAHADTIRGKVSDPENKPLRGVIIKVAGDDGATAAYSLSKGDGCYLLNVPDSLGTDTKVTFESQGYEHATRRLGHLHQYPDVEMTPGGKQLEEVVVMPSPIQSRGDTVVYSVDALRNASDRTIEDVISHLPGITVEDSGTILYNGESINRFYIEGLDMLGGRYSLASRNIRAEDVTSVSVYERHQPVKALKDATVSDKAALNLTLKKRAMLRPSGHISGGAGLESHGTAWRGEGFMMLISGKAQTFLHAKGSNFGNGYFSDSQMQTQTFNWANPPLDNTYVTSSINSSGIPAGRFRRLTSQSYSANSGTRIGENSSISAQISYDDNSQSWQGESATVYQTGSGAGDVTLTQTETGTYSSGNLQATLNFDHNTEEVYIGERLGLRARRDHGRLGLCAMPPPDVDQATKRHSIELANNLGIIVKTGKRIWQLTSDIALSLLPDNVMTASSRPEGKRIVWQQAASKTFVTRHITSLGWGLPGGWTAGAVVTLGTRYTDIDAYAITSDGDTHTCINRQHGNEATLDAGPYLQWQNRHTTVRLDIPLSGTLLSGRGLDLPDGASEMDKTYGDIGMKVRLDHKFSQSLTISANLARSSSTGGIDDLITSPVWRSYRMLTSMSDGLPARRHTWSATAWLKYKNMITGLFGNLRGSLRRSDSNRTTVSEIDAGGESVSVAGGKSHRDIADVWGQIGWLAGRSTIRASAGYARTGSTSWRNNVSLSASNSLTDVEISATIQLVPRKLDIDPKASMRISRNKVKGTVTDTGSAMSLEAGMPVACFPLRGLEIKANPLYSYNRTADGNGNGGWFIDMSSRYTWKKWEFEIILSNIADRRRYTSAAFSGLDIYTTTLSLRGFEALASVKYSF